MTTTHALPDLDAVRAAFPALEADTVFLENAGGSQVPGVVADAVRDYMRSTYVQLGADYALSEKATAVVDRAHDFVRLLMGGEGVGEVVLGASSSALCRMLADAYLPTIRPGDEIVVAEAGHEANIGPWLRLEAAGATIRWWRVDPETGHTSLDTLSGVLNERTRIVAFPHVSNLLGEITDVEAVTRMAHAVGARVVVDGVAYAPHRAMDVRAWGVDYYTYSIYKVYGPHMGAMFGRPEAWAEVEGPNHFFVPKGEVPYKFELGGVSHEGAAGLLASAGYLAFLAGEREATRDASLRAFTRMEAWERPLQEQLVGWVREHPALRIVGPDHAGEGRVATVSFLHRSKTSREVSLAANAAGFGIRHGHMYAHRLCTAMGIDPEDGVVRVSAVHYNTPAEIERLIEVLEPAL